MNGGFLGPPQSCTGGDLVYNPKVSQQVHPVSEPLADKHFHGSGLLFSRQPTIFGLKTGKDFSISVIAKRSSWESIPALKNVIRAIRKGRTSTGSQDSEWLTGRPPVT
jgi:hypothetical protein